MKAKSTRIVLLSILLLLATQGGAFADTFTDRFEETYKVDPDVEVSLSNTNGSITVEIWEQSAVRLVAAKRVSSHSAETGDQALEAIEIIVHESDGRIEIETRHPKSMNGVFDWLFRRSYNASVSYELKVPRGAEIALHTVNGNISTDGSEGAQRLRSTNGRIEVDSAHRRVDAHTTNGSINVEVAAAEELEIELATTNGSITVHLPTDVRGSLEARTVNGSVRTDVPLTVEGSSSRKRVRGVFNGDSNGHIVLHTTNGSIRIVESTS